MCWEFPLLVANHLIEWFLNLWPNQAKASKKNFFSKLFKLLILELFIKMTDTTLVVPNPKRKNEVTSKAHARPSSMGVGLGCFLDGEAFYWYGPPEQKSFSRLPSVAACLGI